MIPKIVRMPPKVVNFPIPGCLSHLISYTPEPDMCFIFPSSVAHSVTPNPSDRPRVSIAMDTLFTLKEYTRDEALLPPPTDWKEFEL